MRDKGREKDKEQGRKVGTGRERSKGKGGSLHASMTYHMLVHTVFFGIISFMRAPPLSPTPHATVVAAPGQYPW